MVLAEYVSNGTFGENANLILNIRKRYLRFLEHVMRKEWARD